MPVKKMIILFDESGTPSINNDERTDWFIGVGVAYQQSDEKSIFTKCDADFGLSNSKPLKNGRIGASRVKRMANLLTDLPLSVFVSAINTANPTLRNVIVKYELFGEKARRKFRKIRKRPIPQIIHSHVLNQCLFKLITEHFEKDRKDASFEIFIDDWSMPENDINILIKYRVQVLHQEISKLCDSFSMGHLISIAPLKLLSKDSDRKRFADGMASIFSRKYLNPNNNKYSNDGVEVLKKCPKVQFGDMTQHSIDNMKRVMSEATGRG